MRLMLFILVVLSSSACSKFTQERKWAVNYQVIVLSGNGEYVVTYRNKSGATIQKGRLSGNWVSPTLEDFEEGTPVYMKVERVKGNSVLEVNILRSAGLLETGVLEKSVTVLELNDTI